MFLTHCSVRVLYYRVCSFLKWNNFPTFAPHEVLLLFFLNSLTVSCEKCDVCFLFASRVSCFPLTRGHFPSRLSTTSTAILCNNLGGERLNIFSLALRSRNRCKVINVFQAGWLAGQRQKIKMVKDKRIKVCHEHIFFFVLVAWGLHIIPKN